MHCTNDLGNEWLGLVVPYEGAIEFSFGSDILDTTLLIIRKAIICTKEKLYTKGSVELLVILEAHSRLKIEAIAGSTLWWPWYHKFCIFFRSCSLAQGNVLS
jgi:hypothetical protein